MKHTILQFHESNMAGQSWAWIFKLEAKNGTFVLSAEQKFDRNDEDDDPLEINPRTGLRGGADVYEALQEMLEEIFEDLKHFDLDAISVEITKFDAKTADQFTRGHQLLIRREQRQQRKAKKSREMALEQYQAKIDDYCSKLSDDRTRGGGGISRPSESSRVRAFLEHHVLEHGELPKGYHTWRLGNGFLSGERDFSDLE